MKLTFLGADREVTGSCTQLEAAGHRILIDCGMEQGRDVYENADLPYAPGTYEALLLTHARTLAGLDGVSRTYQESLSEYEPAGDTVLIVTDTQTLAAIGTENYTVLRDYGDVYWDVRMNINDLTENFTTDFILPEAPRYGVGRNNK